jgi:ribosomal protein S18 acetylase RimI-like enzyme
VVQVRDAMPDDLVSIVAIDEIARVERARVEFVREALATQVVCVAVDDSRVIGYGVLEHTFFGQGFISMIYVAAGSRRQGIGRQLLRALDGRCETRKLFTSTNSSNGAMQALLSEAGFAASGVIHNLDPGDPELVYFRDRDTNCHKNPGW